jgi:hypothetical protein
MDPIRSRKVLEDSRSRNSTQTSQRNAEGHRENRASSISVRAVNRFSRFFLCSALFAGSVLSFAGIGRFDEV